MTKTFLFLVLTALLFTSCKEEEDTIPQSELAGTYEISNEINATGIWMVNQYIFAADRTMEQIGLMRDSEKGGVLGYVYYTRGSYSIRGFNLVISMTEAYTLNYQANPKGYAETIEELKAATLSAEFVDFNGRVIRAAAGTKTSIALVCSEIIGPTPTNCVGERVFYRVD
ncbi:hypothetical protein GCM10009119_02120 [Algoriphagus jejuensis]|uniref:Lipocalin-like domain-containing protein n=1 Tax=Algoriphagus jejuensis TaxID=419934 RepID=A0ABP3Y9C7_9BACT